LFYREFSSSYGTFSFFLEGSHSFTERSYCFVESSHSFIESSYCFIESSPSPHGTFSISYGHSPFLYGEFSLVYIEFLCFCKEFLFFYRGLSLFFIGLGWGDEASKPNPDLSRSKTDRHHVMIRHHPCFPSSHIITQTLLQPQQLSPEVPSQPVKRICMVTSLADGPC
jgi:hypothetical protein